MVTFVSASCAPPPVMVPQLFQRRRSTGMIMTAIVVMRFPWGVLLRQLHKVVLFSVCQRWRRAPMHNLVECSRPAMRSGVRHTGTRHSRAAAAAQTCVKHQKSTATAWAVIVNDTRASSCRHCRRESGHTEAASKGLGEPGSTSRQCAQWDLRMSGHLEDFTQTNIPHLSSVPPASLQAAGMHSRPRV